MAEHVQKENVNVSSEEEYAPPVEGVHYAGSIKEQLTVRGLIIGIIFCIIFSASSIYMMLKLGTATTTAFVAVCATMAILKALRNTNVNEINVTHTLMTAGGYVSAIVGCTVPTLYVIYGKSFGGVKASSVMIVTVMGVLLGIVFLYFLRKKFMMKDGLPYPVGTISAQIVMAGDQGGGKIKKTSGSLGIAALFTLLRDLWRIIPAHTIAKPLVSNNMMFGIYWSPMICAVGYCIGPFMALVYFAGSILGWVLLPPLAMSQGWADAAAAGSLRTAIALGLLVGGGFGILIRQILPKAKEIYGPMFVKGDDSKKILRFLPLIVAVAVFTATCFTEMTLGATLIAVIGAWLTTAMATYSTGTTTITPADSLAMMVLIIGKAILPHMTPMEGILLACAVATACSISADVGNDFKEAYLLRTNFKAQLITLSLGGIIGAIVSVFLVIALVGAAGVGDGTPYAAPQAFAFAGILDGMPYITVFYVTVIIGAAIQTVFKKFPVITLGIGAYLAQLMGTMVLIGGIIAWIVKKRTPDRNMVKYQEGLYIAGGAAAGESIMGVVLALVKIFA